MRYYLAVLCVLVIAMMSLSAPPPTSNTPPASSQYDELAKTVADHGTRLAALEGERGAKAGPDCGCVNFKTRCTCGPNCPCEGEPGVFGAKASVVKGYHQGKECWLPEGYKLDGWVRHDALLSDCSSGVCRMVPASQVYDRPAVTYSAPTYYQSSSGFGQIYERGGFGGRFPSFSFGGGGCAGGNCR